MRRRVFKAINSYRFAGYWTPRTGRSQLYQHGFESLEWGLQLASSSNRRVAQAEWVIGQTLSTGSSDPALAPYTLEIRQPNLIFGLLDKLYNLVLSICLRCIVDTWKNLLIIIINVRSIVVFIYALCSRCALVYFLYISSPVTFCVGRATIYELCETMTHKQGSKP